MRLSYNGHEADLMALKPGITTKYETPYFKGTLLVFHINGHEADLMSPESAHNK